MTVKGRVRARRGTGTITARGGRIQAQVSLGVDAGGRRIRRGRTFDSRTQAAAWIVRQQLEHRLLDHPVTDDHLEDYLRWWAPRRGAQRQAAAGLWRGPWGRGVARLWRFRDDTAEDADLAAGRLFTG